MKAIFNERERRVAFAKSRVDDQLEAAKELILLSDGLKRDAQLNETRRHYATAKIQGLVRGFFARLHTRELLRQHRAAKAIQRVLRGKFGRKRWLKFFALKTAVVKSDHALKMILERSTVIRAVDKGTNHKDQHWKELYDPLTRGIWYYNEHTRINTWTCPFLFHKDLVCHWEGFENVGEEDMLATRKPVTQKNLVKSARGEEKQQQSKKVKCRCVFKTVIDYQTHLRTAHKWFCSACESSNIGANYPRCFFCGNVRCENTDDGEMLLVDAYNRLHQRLEKFLKKEEAEANKNRYVLKDRVLKIVAEKNEQVEQARAEKQCRKVAKNKRAGLLVRKRVAFAVEEIQNDPEIDDTLFPQTKMSSVSFAARMKEQTAKAREEAEFNAQFLDPVNKMQVSTLEFEEAIDTTEYSKEHLLHMALMEKLMSEDDDDDDSFDMRSMQSSHTKMGSPQAPSHAPTSFHFAQSLLSNTDRAQGKLLVCEQYLAGDCHLTTCPLAHPGLRDSAKIKSVRILKKKNDTRLTKVPAVTLCPLSHGVAARCPHGMTCHYYHIYVRPATSEIIERIYPFKGGPKVKDFPSGLRFSGTESGESESLHGYGIFTWANGSTYAGDFRDGRREGFGIFRQAGGDAEYVGGWRNNARHGLGVYWNRNGEEYSGEWKDGQMEGVGVYTSHIWSQDNDEVGEENGMDGQGWRDVYAGEFKNHKFHGLGKYQKANGDVFVGYCEEGLAQGLGILSLNSGEKYKGYFDRNLRHGQGICIYCDGSRYAGHWYRGVREGFGLLLSKTGERYVGHWAGDRKEGKGRYSFLNGDVYDGEFHRDKANGKGIYYHNNGNIYSGEWVNDCRSGRGTYAYTEGTRYTGSWAYNIMEGKGKFDYACGAFYRGHVKRGIKHGKGVYTWPNGNEYTGEFEDGLICGFGELRYVNGHRYVGRWNDNKKNGPGVFYYNMGHVYDGMWVDDLRHGRGKMTFLSDSPAMEIYEGDWDDDEKHGQGKYTYNSDNGGCYEGAWVRGIRHGKGKHTFKDGSFYRGDFVREKMCGHGVLVRADNSSQYDGAWLDNMRHGKGTLIASDGTIFVGDFYLNRKHGRGREIRPDGTVFEGTWEDDIITGDGRVTLSGLNGLGKSMNVKVLGY